MLDKINKHIISLKKREDLCGAGVLVLLKAELINNQKAKKPRPEMDVAQAFYKQLVKSKDLYMELNKSAMAKALCYQMVIVDAYLPKKMDPSAVRYKVEEYFKKNGGVIAKKDMGKVIGALKKALGNENAQRIAQCVKEHVK